MCPAPKTTRRVTMMTERRQQPQPQQMVAVTTTTTTTVVIITITIIAIIIIVAVVVDVGAAAAAAAAASCEMRAKGRALARGRRLDDEALSARPTTPLLSQHNARRLRSAARVALRAKLHPRAACCARARARVVGAPTPLGLEQLVRSAARAHAHSRAKPRAHTSEADNHRRRPLGSTPARLAAAAAAPSLVSPYLSAPPTVWLAVKLSVCLPPACLSVRPICNQHVRPRVCQGPRRVRSHLHLGRRLVRA